MELIHLSPLDLIPDSGKLIFCCRIYFSWHSLLLDAVAFLAPAIWSWELDASSHQKSIVRVFIVLFHAQTVFPLKRISKDGLSVLIWRELNTKWHSSVLLTCFVSKNVRGCCLFFVVLSFITPNPDWMCDSWQEHEKLMLMILSIGLHASRWD